MESCIITMFQRTCILALSFILLLAAAANADIIGKVVSVADGDTITVLQARTQHRIRLYGIDCPESHQDFGNRAKQLASDLVFGKQVRVVQKDMDRYGRVVGVVYIGDVCVNEELVRKGMAWVYRRYCTDGVCNCGWAPENTGFFITMTPTWFLMAKGFPLSRSLRALKTKISGK